MNEYVLVSVPMFILMASIMERSGVAKDLFNAMRVWAGRLPGGLAVRPWSRRIMGAMTGIIGGEIVLLGLVALPQMLRLGYDRKLAIGMICAGGALGTMIPPSDRAGDLRSRRQRLDRRSVRGHRHARPDDGGDLHALHLHPLPPRSVAGAGGAGATSATFRSRRSCVC